MKRMVFVNKSENFAELIEFTEILNTELNWPFSRIGHQRQRDRPRKSDWLVPFSTTGAELVRFKDWTNTTFKNLIQTTEHEMHQKNCR